MSQEALVLEKGDIIIQQDEDATWSVVRILELDVWPDSSLTAHCMTYHHASEKPDLDSLKDLKVFIGHAPIAATSFEYGWERIGNEPVLPQHVFGFVEYLKQTDFQRYATYTGQDIEDIVSRANAHYSAGYALGTEGKTQEAIREYSAAIDLFPLFFEAIDNRGFS